MDKSEKLIKITWKKEIPIILRLFKNSPGTEYIINDKSIEIISPKQRKVIYWSEVDYYSPHYREEPNDSMVMDLLWTLAGAKAKQIGYKFFLKKSKPLHKYFFCDFYLSVPPEKLEQMKLLLQKIQLRKNVQAGVVARLFPPFFVAIIIGSIILLYFVFR